MSRFSGWIAEKILRRELNEHALPFAQQYLSRPLAHSEQVKVVKLMLRCRLVREAFRPLAGDRQPALQAAMESGNNELVSYLRSIPN